MDRLTAIENQLRSLTIAHNNLYSKVKKLEEALSEVSSQEVEDENRVVLNDGETYLSEDELKKRGF